MNWGPGVALRWANGATLRVGTRIDSLLQANMQYLETLAGHHEPSEWVWIRGRWTDAGGVLEASSDGEHFEGIHEFRHSGAFNAPLTEVLVGKVPGQGAPVDFSIPGELGESDIDYVRVYGQ